MNPVAFVSADPPDEIAGDSPATVTRTDAYFSADVETDGPIPGPFSLLSFALVYAGSFDGARFESPRTLDETFYRELRPISDRFEADALRVNGLDRDRLQRVGCDPRDAMSDAASWVRRVAAGRRPVLVAFPLSFDWTWLYWYFVQYSREGSPFNHSSCFDIKTALAVKSRQPIAASGRAGLHAELRSARLHTHHAVDDAREQAEIFGKLFDWEAPNGRGAR